MRFGKHASSKAVRIGRQWPLLRFVADPAIHFIFLRDIRPRLYGLKYAAENTDILSRLRQTTP